MPVRTARSPVLLPSRPGFPEQVLGVEPTRPEVGLAGKQALPVRRGGRCRDPRPVDLEGSRRSALQVGVPVVRRSAEVLVDGPLLLTPRHGCRTRLRR